MMTRSQSHEESSLARLTAEVHGRVQGVGYRYFIQAQAHRLGVKGWVRNRWDGGVELEAEGPRETLERFLEAVRQGPPTARVERVNVVWGPYTGQYDRFEVRF